MVWFRGAFCIFRSVCVHGLLWSWDGVLVPHGPPAPRRAARGREDQECVKCYNYNLCMCFKGYFLYIFIYRIGKFDLMKIHKIIKSRKYCMMPKKTKPWQSILGPAHGLLHWLNHTPTFDGVAAHQFVLRAGQALPVHHKPLRTNDLRKQRQNIKLYCL